MDQEKPGPIKYDQACLAFAESNGAAPTYADVLWSNVPQDSSSPVPGVFANDQADVRSAAVLAHTAYHASGGTASVSIALWSPDGQPPADMGDWQAAVAAAPVGNSQLLAKLRAALGPASKTTLLSRVPKAHTKDELSELLKAAAMGRDKRTAAAAQSTGASAGGDHGGSGELDETNQQAEQLATMAKDFLAARKDKAQEKALKRQLADGTWEPLLSSLAAQVDSSPPFAYYGYAAAAGRGTCGALLEYLSSSQFLHFNLEKLDS